MTYKDFRCTIGRRLSDAREGKQLSRFKISQEIGMDVADILAIEQGYRIPSVKVLTQFCGMYGISLEDLFRGIKNPELTDDQKRIKAYDKARA